MSDTIIAAESVGKRYVLSHQAGGGGYRKFSDEIMNAVRRPIQWLSRKAPDTREEFWALKDVSFEIKRGEVVGIIGRNGAGKSTLLKVLSRITEPTSGRIKLRGRVASLLEVGTGFHPELTGRENIYLNGAILGMQRNEIKSKFDEIVAFAEIERFLDTPVKRYSSGMYVRLAFAVAAHLEPEILIVDEVLAVGDTQFQSKCLGKMKDVAKGGGRTVLFVSHQLGMVRELCTRGLLMKNGGVAFAGSTGDVIDRYQNHALSAGQTLRSKHVANISGWNGEAVPSFVFGESLRLRIGLRELHGIAAGLNVSFRNEAGLLICLFSTNPHDGVAIPEGECEISIKIPDCRFAPGSYTVDLAVTDPGFSVIEELPSALQLTVTPRAIGGSWPYEARYGEYFPVHEWSVTGH
jgi:lipopolysaccharide transport system ATP-binding protein